MTFLRKCSFFVTRRHNNWGYEGTKWQREKVLILVTYTRMPDGNLEGRGVQQISNLTLAQFEEVLIFRDTQTIKHPWYHHYEPYSYHLYKEWEYVTLSYSIYKEVNSHTFFFFNFRLMRLVWGIYLSKISRRRLSGHVLKRGLEFAFTWDVITNSLQLSLNRLNKFKSWALLGLSIPFYFVDDMYSSRTQLKKNSAWKGSLKTKWRNEDFLS